MKTIIQSLPKYVKLTGSYARGEQTENSDYDFYVPESKWEHFKEWSRKNIKGVPTSCFPMTLTWKLEGEQIEFSSIFRKQNNPLSEVELFGRTFQTR